jgi:hypothetical protein
MAETQIADGNRPLSRLGSPGADEPEAEMSEASDIDLLLGDWTTRQRRLRTWLAGSDVRYMWRAVTSPTPHWEQAFSADGGETWETNWVAEFTRVDGDS